MTTKTDLGRALGRAESQGDGFRRGNEREREAVTLIEVVVIIAIIGVIYLGVFGNSVIEKFSQTITVQARIEK